MGAPQPYVAPGRGAPTIDSSRAYAISKNTPLGRLCPGVADGATSATVGELPRQAAPPEGSTRRSSPTPAATPGWPCSFEQGKESGLLSGTLRSMVEDKWWAELHVDVRPWSDSGPCRALGCSGTEARTGCPSRALREARAESACWLPHQGGAMPKRLARQSETRESLDQHSHAEQGKTSSR
jgi:hypothetical protein